MQYNILPANVVTMHMHMASIDNQTGAAPLAEAARRPGDRSSAKGAHSEKKGNAGAKERDKMRSQVKNHIIQYFSEFSCGSLFPSSQTCIIHVLQMMQELPFPTQQGFDGQRCLILPSRMV
jgi:hypothetical protein